jgi:endonuclease/exonuclease/phosphatase family metal-dependent hydrolase
VKLLLKKFGFLLNIIATVFLLLAYLAPFIAPDIFWPFSIIGLSYPLLLALNIFFLVLWIVQRSKKLLLPLIAILIGIGYFNNYFQFHAVRKEIHDGIKILTYNVNYFSYDLKNRKSSPNNLIGYLRASESDIICLQETYIRRSGNLSLETIMNTIPNIKYYQLAHSVSFGGPVTFSRYPIINMGEIRFANTSNMVIFSDIKVNDNEIIRIYNCHFQSFQIRPEDYTVIESPVSGSNRLKAKEVLELSHKLISAFSIRAFQARKVSEHIKNCPYPVVVCGDFNDTPCSYTYRKVLGNLKDAFVESGFGISNTYHGILPSFRIDYIFHSKEYRSYNYIRKRIVYSDHYPLSCIFKHE